MKNTENNKKLYRRYLDDLYTTEDARQLLNSLHDPDNHETLNELSSDVWEETATQQPYTDLEREHYKREARQLLKHIEHKKRTWFHRIAVVTASTAAIVCLVLSGIHYLEHLNEQQIIYLEASTSYGERKQLLLPDGTQLTLNSCSHVRYPNNFTGEERKIVLEGEGYFQVHRNEEQPFIVSTRRFDVRVLGTCFEPENTTTDKTSISFCTLSVSNEPQNTVRHSEQYSRSAKGPATIHRPPVNRSFSNIGFLQHLWKWGSFFYAFPNRYQYLQPFMTFLSVYHFVTSSYRTSQSFPSSSMTKSGMYTAFSRMQQVLIISLGAVFFPFR